MPATHGTARATTQAQAIASALGGARKSGVGWLARCCCHDDGDPSLSLSVGDDGRLLLYCFAGCNGVDILRELRARGLLDDDERERYQRQQLHRPAPPLQAIDGPARIARLLGLCRPIRGTVVERYLVEHRGVDLPDTDALRYLPPRLPHFPHAAMVAVVTDFADAARTMTLQFTFIANDGSKAGDTRPFLKGCPARGGVVRLVDDAEITDRLGIAEGVESALAAMSGFRRSGHLVPPVWAALSAGNLARLPVLPAIEVLRIFADNDPNNVGQLAARELGRTWRAAGREVFITTRSNGGDWNDAP